MLSCVFLGVLLLGTFALTMAPSQSRAALLSPAIVDGPSEGAHVNQSNVSFTLDGLFDVGHDPAFGDHDFMCSLDGLPFGWCQGFQLPDCRADAGFGWVCTQAKAYSGLADGAHHFYARSYYCATPCYAGDEEFSAYLTRGFTVDTQRPIVNLTGPAGMVPQTIGAARFYFDANEQASFTCKSDKRPAVACVSPFRLTRLHSGRHALEVIATDLAGNASLPTIWTYRIKLKPLAAKTNCKTVKVRRHGKLVKKRKCVKVKSKVAG